MSVTWAQIEEFPNYSINKSGDILNIETGKLIHQSTTNQGAVKVNLSKNGKQYTRSVKLLVAIAFVKGRTDVFDTPIHLDNNPQNNTVRNLAWRPRWFAWKYTHQFQNIAETHNTGPVLNITTGTIHSSVVSAATANGLLFTDIWKSIRMKEPVFPNNLEFEFVRSR